MRLLPQRWNRPSRRWAVVVVMLLVALAAVTHSALSTKAGHEPPSRENGEEMPALQAKDSSLSDSIVRTITRTAPFQPDRIPPDERYVLPTSRSDPAKAPTSSPLPRLRLVGTAVQQGGAQLAAFQGEQRAKVLRAGGKMGPFQVTKIEPGTVTLVGPDTTLTLHVPRPGTKDGQP